ncbi:hypothetical protein ACFU8R_25485 [Pseudonocardia alni]|uniref:hypothetical protein n=1 Tax=Pseudonocardia alni TaxID=33907 RepID=UPI00333028E8
MPPRRLRICGALAADAQRAAGAMPMAELFIRTTCRAVPTPPLQLGIACDVSGSMREFARPSSRRLRTERGTPGWSRQCRS